jgi:hypothetical protein
MSEINLFIELINNMSNIYDSNTKKTLTNYNKLIFKRFLNYYIIIFKNRNFASFNDIKKYLNNNNINIKYVTNNDIEFYNNYILNNFIETNNNDLNEFILIHNIKEKITNKNLFIQFINDIKHLININDIENLKKLDDFFDNYESLLCTNLKQGETFKGPFIDIYKIDDSKFKEINQILENYKIKKK